MEFGSEYILMEDESEDVYQNADYDSVEEEVPSEQGGVSFECEIMDFEESKRPAQVQPGKKVNTNNVSLKMSSLNIEPEQTLLTSQLVNCENDDCEAVLSHIDHLEPDSEGRKIWICKFCAQKNILEKEVPQVLKQDVIYVDDPNNLPDMMTPCDDEKIIFVIDVSGSMCQTTEVPIEHLSPRLKDLYLKELETERLIMQLQNGGHQLAQGPSLLDRRFCYIRRLQAVKAGILESIDYLKENRPSVKVGLVTFSDTVHIYGDGGTRTEVQVSHLDDGAQLFEKGVANGDLKCVSEAARNLINTTEDLIDGGQTALGPALIVAKGMAMSAKNSKIIMCTDGLANVGIGKLEDSDSVIKDFYNDVIFDAKSWGMSVSVICFDDCGLHTKLGEMPNETGGTVARIKATETSELLEEELKTKTMAKNASLTILANRDMYISIDSQADSNVNCVSKDIGNVNEKKCIPFTFGFQKAQPQQDGDGSHVSDQQGAAASSVSNASCSQQAIEMTDEPKDYPFQTKINFTDMRGVKACRIWTTSKPITKNRSQAESAMNIETALSNFCQKSADDILNGSQKKMDLIRRTGNVASEVKDYFKKISGPQAKTLREKLATFHEVVKKINKNQRVTEEDANILRKFQANRSVGTN